jgi:hypothetical protein
MEPIEPEASQLSPPPSPPEPDLRIGDRIKVLRPDLDDCDCALPQETIDLFRGIVGHEFVVRGFDRYGNIEIWAKDDGSPSESPCGHSLWVRRSAIQPISYPA